MALLLAIGNFLQDFVLKELVLIKNFVVQMEILTNEHVAETVTMHQLTHVKREEHHKTTKLYLISLHKKTDTSINQYPENSTKGVLKTVLLYLFNSTEEIYTPFYLYCFSYPENIPQPRDIAKVRNIFFITGCTLPPPLFYDPLKQYLLAIRI